MPSTLKDICFDCDDAERTARFWAAVFGYEVHHGPAELGSVAISPPEGVDGMRYWFSPVPEPKVAKNRVHIDIVMPDEAEMDHLLGLGATKVQEVNGPDGTHWWTVMADVEGNEFCAFRPNTK